MEKFFIYLQFLNLKIYVVFYLIKEVWTIRLSVDKITTLYRHEWRSESFNLVSDVIL